ncbi:MULTISPECIES: hypothetical protein [Nitrobacteraceae]|jgi:hypothetical protein|uniref:Uncharacterized protein n=3 Tax=Nitrobacteraceae TaxID=41294 RepID=A0A5P6PGF2_9BRAD|nr:MULTISPECIES: hypothetical protein [Nitrobacteraceae]EKS26865.1 hypothetical protein HMPREF9697_03981 [Afipia felis ATCC 53690]MCS3731054.1 hypothetical protein [Bradyrhizobium betae]QFI77489.1 hypothetical protein F8237_34765 [Bradyrhizobium betae]SUW21302.1 Uncharacterised protein [Afipia felis]SUW28032.1 Uncharacterised protein [Afipia felis]
MTVTHKKRGNARKRAARRESLTLGFVTSLGSIGKDVASRKAARGLLSGFANAIKRAERTGKSVRMTVVVDPKTAAPQIAVEEVSAPKGDRLDSALAAARQRGSARVAEILNGTDMLSADAFAEEIGATRETVHKKRRRHEVLGLEGPKRGVRFPKWQVSGSGGLIPSLPQLFEVLGDHPWTIYRFLLEEHGELDGRTGLEALRAGRIADVMATAETIGRGAFS